jgi:hypothetical protein
MRRGGGGSQKRAAVSGKGRDDLLLAAGDANRRTAAVCQSGDLPPLQYCSRTLRLLEKQAPRGACVSSGLWNAVFLKPAVRPGDAESTLRLENPKIQLSYY